MRPIQSALHAIAIIGQQQPVGVSAIARALDLPKTTVHRVLKSLQAAGWIDAEPDERALWSLTIKAGLAVGPVEYATRHLRGAAFPIMEELRSRTGESIYLAIRDDNTLALIERLDGTKPISHAWPLLQRGPLHASSLGKSILAQLSVEEQDAYLGSTLQKHTSQTLIDPEMLRSDLALIRSRGFATSFRENWPNENGVGAAIRDSTGLPTAAISISAPAERVDEARCLELGPLLAEAAGRISLGLSRK